MGSGYYGEPNLGNERGSSSSSRKGKKGNSDKPKQPQRGLGVAQLEKIRLHGQLGYQQYPPLHSPFPPSPNFNQDDMRVQATYSSIPSSSFPYSSSSMSSHSQHASSYGFHPNMMMGLGDYERTNAIYGDSYPSNVASWNHGTHFGQAITTSYFPNPQVEEDSKPNTSKKHRSGSRGSSSQNSESSDNQEVDLELRLSL